MEIFRFDVLCIGSGVAGLMASTFAAKAGAKVCVLSKEPLGWGNTRISGGIIASRGQNKQGLYQDMMRSGSSLNQTHLIESLLNHSLDIHEVVESMGHVYLRGESSSHEKIWIKPGGHSEPRTLISHHRGLSLANALRNQVLQQNIDTLEEVVACEILTQNNRAVGVLAYDWKKGTWLSILAPQTIIACGGAGMIYYPHTDNMRSATGDGYALGLVAGASLVDMEQVQFLPFGVAYPAGMVGLELGDTSAAGPYGVLRTKDGQVIMDHLPGKTREEVSRTIALEVKKGNGSSHGAVWLDPTENRKYPEGEESWKNWKSIGSLEPLRMAYGAKAYQWQEPFEVIPTQHYCMGGISIDHAGQTGVPGLMAVGESAGGLHGGGRMGSMSLFEGLVFGRLVGEKAIENINAVTDISVSRLQEQKSHFLNAYQSKKKGGYSPIKLKRELGHVMWENVGLLRNQDNLDKAMQAVEEIEEKAKQISLNSSQSFDPLMLEAIELRSMLLTSKAITLSAQYRKESRGSHYRTDFPNPDVNWERRILFVKYSDGRVIVTKEVGV